MSEYPSELLYTKEHEWLKIEGQTGTVGITRYAIEQLGDVVHLDLPKTGVTFKPGDTFGTIESTKTVSDLYMPLAATVTAVNTELVNAPELITDDPHGKYWLCKISIAEAPKGLLSAAEYEKYIAEDSKH